MEDRIKPDAKGCTEPYKGKPGVYRIYFSLGKDPETGKYLRTKKRTYHCKSKNPKNWPKELENELAVYRKELEGGEERPTARRTLASYAEDFHTMREGTMGSPLAYEREGYDIRHIKELFGNATLKSIKPDDITKAYAEARKSGRFSETEIRKIHIKLKQIMQEAYVNDLISKNSCIGVKLPKPNVEARSFLPPEELPKFARCLEEEGMYPATVCTMLIFHLGVRKGEALGFSWEDYDASVPEIHVNWQYTSDKTLRPPKSDMSKRVLAVDEILAEYLEVWKKKQREELEKLGIEQTEKTPIVHAIGTSDDSMPFVTHVDGHNYSRWFRNFCVDNGYGSYKNVTKTFVRKGKKYVRGTGYEGLVVHGLRHTVATALISSGVDTNTVQARLGHASPSTTLAIYNHALKSNDRKAANTYEALLEGNSESKQNRPSDTDEAE